VTIAVLDQTAGPEDLARDLPLQGISFDTKGTRPCSIEISAGDVEAHVRHVIDLPLRIHKAQQDDGAIDVRIEPARGPVTLIHVRRPEVH
jgi:hypothetical protein